MGTGLGNFTFLDHDDFVSVPDCRDPVGYCYDRILVPDICNGFLDNLLRF
jgi:hypothetical protein